MIKCIYLHIPFCQKKCNYCSFCSFTLLKEKENYINSLLKEINSYYNFEYLSTLYFGGGTPSLLDAGDFERILKTFNFDLMTEITLEINPNTVDMLKLKQLKNLGINRLSVGVQCFDDKILKLIGRNHTSKEIFKCIDDINKAGFDNFSIDIIYGLPTQTLKHWENTLDNIKDINPKHISLYGLKIEKGTYFYKFLPKNLPDMDTQAKMYEMATEKLEKNYLHYEFSSFAKNKDYISKHNSACWNRYDYWGFGLSASGFVNNRRYTNTTNFKNYLKNPNQKLWENLSVQQQLEEEIFLGLRLYEGIDFELINKKYNINIKEKYFSLFEKFTKEGFMKYTKNGIKLTKKGILVSNMIMCEFIEI